MFMLLLKHKEIVFFEMRWERTVVKNKRTPQVIQILYGDPFPYLFMPLDQARNQISDAQQTCF